MQIEISNQEISFSCDLKTKYFTSKMLLFPLEKVINPLLLSYSIKELVASVSRGWSDLILCGSLNENGLHRLMCLNT